MSGPDAVRQAVNDALDVNLAGTWIDVAEQVPWAARRARALVLLAYRGLRWGEAVALRVRDVRFLRRRPSVHDNAVQIGARHVVGKTKRRKEQSVPVPQFVLDELAVQCEGRDLDDLVFGDCTYLPRPKSTNGWFVRAVKQG
jgi:integrase